MADYSGSWYCDECKAHGTNWQGQHNPTCSIAVKVVDYTRQRQLAEQEKERIRAEQYAFWDDIADPDELIEKLKAQDKTAKDYEKIARALREDWQVGIEVVKRRELLGKWFNR